MMAVAAAWDSLAEDLYNTASSDQAVVGELTGPAWSGPAAAAMANAAAPFATWTAATAAQAQQAATQARAAAAAFDTAFAMTVPPPEITANRLLLHALIATNFFGQNLPKIAATEADYAEMWAQDATAMYSYANASADASTLTPFTTPPPVTNPAQQTAEAAMAARMGGTPVGTPSTETIVSHMSRFLSEVPSALKSLAQDPTSDPSVAGGGLSTLLPSSPLQYLTLLTPYTASIATTRLGIQAATYTKANAGPVSAVQTTETVGMTGPPAQPGLSAVADRASTPIIAQRGRAELAGGLSVPATWATASPSIQGQLVSSTAPITSTAPAVGVHNPTGMFSDMTMAPMLRRPTTGSTATSRRARGRVAVMVHYPSAG